MKRIIPTSSPVASETPPLPSDSSHQNHSYQDNVSLGSAVSSGQSTHHQQLKRPKRRRFAALRDHDNSPHGTTNASSAATMESSKHVPTSGISRKRIKRAFQKRNQNVASSLSHQELLGGGNVSGESNDAKRRRSLSSSKRHNRKSTSSQNTSSFGDLSKHYRPSASNQFNSFLQEVKRLNLEVSQLSDRESANHTAKLKSSSNDNDHQNPQLESEISTTTLEIHSLIQFYRIEASIHEFYSSIMRTYPALPSDYYRTLNIILRNIQVHYLHESNQDHLYRTTNEDSSFFIKKDLRTLERKIFRLVKSLLIAKWQSIVVTGSKTLDISSAAAGISNSTPTGATTSTVSGFSSPSTPTGSNKWNSSQQSHNKLFTEILQEIHQWNKLVKDSWDIYADLEQDQSFFSVLLSHQISLSELCTRASDARFCCIYASGGKLPKRIRRISSVSGSNSAGSGHRVHRYSTGASSRQNTSLHRASAPHISRNGRRSFSIGSSTSSYNLYQHQHHTHNQHNASFLYNGETTSPPSKSSQSGSSSARTNSRPRLSLSTKGLSPSPSSMEKSPSSSRFSNLLNLNSFTLDPYYTNEKAESKNGHSRSTSIFYEMNHHFISPSEVEKHIQSMISEEFDFIKRIIWIIENMDECYLPLFDSELNGYPTYRYYRHKTFGAWSRHVGVAPATHQFSSSSMDAPSSFQFINDGVVLDYTDVNRLINRQRSHLLNSASGSRISSPSADLLQTDPLLDQNEDEQLYIPIYGSTVSQVRDYYVQYLSIQMHRFVNMQSEAPSVMGMGALVSGNSGVDSSRSSLLTLGGGTLNTQPQQFSASSSSEVDNDLSAATTTHMDTIRNPLQREFMKLFPNMQRFASREDFNFHRRYTEVQKTELLSCQTHLFSHVHTFLKDTSTRYNLSSSSSDSAALMSSNMHHSNSVNIAGGDVTSSGLPPPAPSSSQKRASTTSLSMENGASSAQPALLEQQRIAQELINEYLVKIVHFVANFAYKHISGYLKLPRLRNMCILHSELTHFVHMIDDIFPLEDAKHRKMNQKSDSSFATFVSTASKSEISASLRRISELNTKLCDMLTEEMEDVCVKFWEEEYKDKQKKKSRNIGLGIICCSANMHLAGPVETNQGQVQRSIEIILQPAFESIACSHPDSRAVLIEKFVTILLTTYLDYIKKLGRKHQRRKRHLLWSVMRRFRSDMIYFHNWIMMTPLLTKLEKQMVIRFNVFDRIDSILFELDASTKSSTKNRSAKYSIQSAKNNDTGATLQHYAVKKSSIVPSEDTESTTSSDDKQHILNANTEGGHQRHKRSSSWIHPARGEFSGISNVHQRSLSEESAKSMVKDISEWKSIFAALG